ncbi:radical SAM protein [Fundidesulfovibrio butyratiphilus]
MFIKTDGHVFGPVRSGRLGASLGLDLLGTKICSFDCLYCEVGPTRGLTRARKPYVPAKRVLDELKAWLAAPHPPFQVVTLGGMGEPTLNSEMGEILAGVRRLVPGMPTAVLTNSSLMGDAQVRRELALADMVLPSMDTLVQSEFEALNRPHPGNALADIRQGLLDFRREYSGKIFLEVLVLDGVNDSDENLELLRRFVQELAPDRVDVTTMSRPGAYREAKSASPQTLERFRQALGRQGCGTEPEKAAQFAIGLDNADSLRLNEIRGFVLESLARRPQTAAQLSRALSVSERELAPLLESLLQAGDASRRQDDNGEAYYFFKDQADR